MSKKVWLTNILVLVIFILDRIFKIYFISNPGASRVFVSNFLSFNLETNPGIAFGLKLPQLFLIPIVVIVIVILIYAILGVYKEKDIISYTALILIVVGAISNFIDRIKYSNVIDYINVEFFTVFNLADTMITVGVAVLIISRLKVLAKK